MSIENVKKALAYGIKHGADQCEFFYSYHQGFSLKIREGALDTFEQENEQGYSVRLLKNGAPGFSFGVNPSLEAMEKAIDDALAAAEFLEREPCQFFTAPGLLYPNLDLTDETIPQITLTDKIALAKEIYNRSDKQTAIRKVESTGYGESTQNVFIVNSLGLDLHYTRNFCYAMATVIAAKDNEAETGSAFRIMQSYHDLEPSEIAEEAVKEGREKLGAKKIPTGDYPIILHPRAFLDLFSILMPSFLGDRVWKKKSLLENKEGVKIAPPSLNFYSDGLWTQGIDSAPFDDEGMPCQKIKLLDEGCVSRFLYDNKNGMRVGKESTGNGYGSFKDWPSVAFSNYYFAPGETGLSKMIAGQEKAVYIKSLMGLHTANSLTGDFSLGVKGHLIKKGEIAHPVAGVAVAGNILGILNNIDAISKELEFYGRKAAPHVLIGKMKISGN